MINLSSPQEDTQIRPRITVVGVGGAGGNAVNNMIKSNLEGVEFLVCNTDAQALNGSLAERRLQLGMHITQGLGAGAKPEIGRAAAEEALEEIASYLEGSHMAFITAGLGGGTGTGAAPVIARAAREQGMLTVGVVTKPFHFEGTHRMRIAEEGLKDLQEYVDTLIVIPNQNLFRIANEKTTFADAFKMADNVLNSGVRGVTDLMVMPGLINLDFADIRSVMAEMGKAMMGTGEAEGDNRAVLAAEAAISNPLLDDVSMKGARGVLINITGGVDMTLYEVDEAANRIRDEVDPEANIIFGSTFDEAIEGTLRVSVVATGIDLAVEDRRPGEAATTNGSADRPRPVALGLGRAGRPAPAPRPAAQPAPEPQPAVARSEEPAARPSLFGGGPTPARPAAQAPAPQAGERQAQATQAHASAESAGLDTATLKSMVISDEREAAAEDRRRTEASPRTAYHDHRSYDEPAYPAARERQEDTGGYGRYEPEGEAEGHPTRPLRRAGNLFRRMTGLFVEEEGEDAGAAHAHRGGRDWGEEPARRATHREERPMAPRGDADQTVRGPAAQPRLDAGHRGPLPKHEDDGFDIPAFLRRQAN